MTMQNLKRGAEFPRPFLVAAEAAVLVTPRLFFEFRGGIFWNWKGYAAKIGHHTPDRGRCDFTAA